MPAPLGIVIPARDEAESIGETLDRIRRLVRTPHTVYLVHDSPEDATLPVAAAHRERGLDLVFLENRAGGAARAIRVGLQRAPNEALLVAMADASDDFSVVDRMYAMIRGGCDLVCGSRYARGGHQSGGPLVKSLLSRGAGLTLRWIGASPVHDVTNSFKMYRRSLLERITITSEGGFEVGMEIAVKAIAGGFRVGEVPCTWEERKRGRSKFRLARALPRYLRWYGYALGVGRGKVSEKT